ncbi:hypothetical protein HBB16_17595 [Pseudonocardia sp. MCCB 268]|nr:hypothetical protein [Pseudonocardia cytotoxica]
MVEDGERRDVSPFRSCRSITQDRRDLTRTIGHPEVVTLPAGRSPVCDAARTDVGRMVSERVPRGPGRSRPGRSPTPEAAVQLDQPQTRPADAPPTVRTPTL